MKVYIADGQITNLGNAEKAKPPALRLRVLLSYWYFKNVDLDKTFAEQFVRGKPEVFGDSGAFSAMMQGHTITLDEYAQWVKRNSHLLDVYSNLDVIGDYRRTQENQDRLEQMGLHPLPVFHAGSPWDELERLIEQYPYIALGGVAGRMNPPMPWLVQCFKRAKGRAVFHGFGITTWNVLKSLPWYSVDSSSWGAGFRYGRVPVFDSRRGQLKTVQLGSKQAWAPYAALLQSMGFDARDFAERSRNTRPKICALSGLSYMLAERWLTTHHRPIHIPQRDSEPGLKLHLAEVQDNLRDIAPVDKAIAAFNKGEQG